MAIFKTGNPEHKFRQKATGRLFFAALLVAEIMLLTQSCSLMPKTIKPGNPGAYLKKQICITRFEDKKRFDDVYLEQSFQDRLMNALLDNCRRPVFIVPGQSQFPAELDTLPMLPSGFTSGSGRVAGFWIPCRMLLAITRSSSSSRSPARMPGRIRSSPRP